MTKWGWVWRNEGGYDGSVNTPWVLVSRLRTSG